MIITVIANDIAFSHYFVRHRTSLVRYVGTDFKKNSMRMMFAKRRQDLFIYAATVWTIVEG